MEKMKELKLQYKMGNINKQEFIKSMHKEHRNIFDYSELIQGTDIKSILIEDNKVIMETRDENIKLICDKDDKRVAPVEIINFDSYDKDEIQILKRLIKKDSVVFDIGANIGYYSLVLSKNVPNGSIHSFEPIPKSFNYLNGNIELNKFDNIKANNIALSDYTGVAQFYYYPEGAVNSSMRKLNKNVENVTIECKVKKLDDYVSENKTKVDLIKCDTEGSEYLVFKGAKEVLIKYKPAIFTELLRKWSKEFEYVPNDLICFLKGFGYRCFIIKNEKIVECEEVTDDTIDTNFIFLHKENHVKVIEELSF